MKRVMQMKKGWIALLAVIIVLAAVFFWKGGHHAFVVRDALEEWLDADSADLSLDFRIQTGGFTVDSETGRLDSNMEQWSFSADAFWSEYTDDRVTGLTAEGMTAYLRDNVLYMDTGRAYALPELSELFKQAERLKTGLLLRGRMTKTGDTYHVTMKTEEMELSADITLDPALQSMTVRATLPDGTVLQATVTPKAPQPHPLPQTVLDAMVRTTMETPPPLSQPLEVLVPALRDLFPVSGALTMGVESGILELSETVQFRMNAQQAELDRKGVTFSIDLPASLNQLQPELLALGLLYYGTYSQEGDTAWLQITLPGEKTADMIAQLIPQAADIGLTCEPSEVVLTIENGKLSAVSLAAHGSVPFLMTTIPLTFTAELIVS